MLPLIHVIDFEGSLRSGVVEFGVVTWQAGRPLRLATRLCAPKARILDAERAVHGLGGAELVGRDPFSSAWEEFCALREAGVLAAHSASAEDTLVRATWPFPRAVPDWLSPGNKVASWGPWVDTERLAARWFAQSGRTSATKLETVVSELKLQAELDDVAGELCPPTRRTWHCAPYDALASALVLAKLWELLGRPDPRTLLAWSAPAAGRAAMEQPELF